MSGWNRPSNLVELLRLRACEGGRGGFTFEAESKDKLQSLTFAELDLRARALAARLQDEGFSGKTALLCYPAGLDFLVGLFGCLYAGVIAVPTNVSRARRAGSRFAAIAADAGASAALTCAAWTQDLSVLSREKPELGDLSWFDSSAVSPGDDDRWRVPTIDPQAPAILQYTSGSTGNPKGVVLTHACLLHNLARMFEVLGLYDGITAVCWLPAFHDMGLIGNLLQAVNSGGHMHLMAPVTFLREPLRWLEAIGQYGAYVSGAPNFAFELCSQRAERAQAEELARLNLSTWKVGYIGAEPISAATLDRFTKTFAAHGFEAETFFPCYGLAEATLMVSGGPGRVQPRSRRLLACALESHRAVPSNNGAPTRQVIGCGRPLEDMEVVIVDPATSLPCPAGDIGEIWVAGPSVAAGYWQRPEDTAHTFSAVRADLPQRRYLRTGDLGYCDDGELFVTGRIKDLIIIRGRNLYPQDVEDAVRQEVTGLDGTPAAAFSVPGPDSEKLVFVQEVARGQTPANADQLFRQVRQTIIEHFEVDVQSLVLIRAGSMPRSSSGKIRRRECQRLFLADELEVVAKCGKESLANPPAPSTNGTGKHNKNAIQAWLIDRLARHLKIPAEKIDIQQPFAAYGLDSMAMVSIAAELEKWLGRKLSGTLLFDAPTIAALAKVLTREEESFEDQGSIADCRLPIADLKANGSSGPGKAAIGNRQSAINPRSSILDPRVAIVGIGCRFPGAETLDAFWKLLREGRHAIRELPPGRGQRRSRHAAANFAGFLDDVQRADLQFFGISPGEGAFIDPQHRLLLEVAWEALEHGSISPHSLAGTSAGVFIGMATADYANLLLSNRQPDDTYSSTGNARAMAANRLSYHFDLRGPSVSIDTACSSSLLAIHYACQSLRAGECDLALAGGVNLILTPQLSDALAQAQFLSPTGRCHTFDAAADGYVRGEGCGVVVLKLLASAIRDGDMILAVIEGSAVNQDGKSNGITAPNGPSQVEVIKRALKQAGRDPKDVSFVETHGTGTALGDPIEFDALAGVVGKGSDPCFLGAVKANVGHLEAAAGMAGLIKVVLQLQHGEIFPLAQFKEINPRIRLDGSRFRLPTQVEPWTAVPRVAGISSFGFGGTNAHLVVSDGSTKIADCRLQIADLDANRPSPLNKSAICNLQSAISRNVHLLPLSARSPQALSELAARYRDVLDGPEPNLEDVCHSAAVGRAHFDHRLCIRAGSVTELRESLDRYLSGTPDSRTQVGCMSYPPPPVTSLSVLQPGEDNGNDFLENLGRLYVQGATIPWPDLFRDRNCRRVVLPTYPFQRQRFWIDEPDAGIPKPIADCRLQIADLKASSSTPGKSAICNLPSAITWVPRSHWGQKLPRRPLGEAGNLHRLVEGLGGTITRLGTQHNLKRFTGLRREFDRLTTRYVVETFSRLSWTPEIGTQINAETLGQTLGILPRYQRLLNRLLAMGMEDGLLRGQEGDFIIASWPQPGTAGDLHQELVEKYPGCATELTLAHRCASNMAAVMKGTCDPLHVLFGEDMVQLTERLYEKSPVAGFFNELLAQAVGALVSALPPDRPIRILEVGAGTGGTSAHIAPLLPADRAEYVFSDVSNVFLSRAKEKFAGFSFLQYRLLDLEKDLTEQGFAEGQFDLIVAANVLHATRDIRRSLQQARRLLVPGGLLFLLEGTQRHRLLDIIFGLTEGWWQFTDTDLRPDYPLLSPQEWLEVLGRENFEALQVPAGFDEQSVLIARTAARELRSAGAPSTAALGTILPTVTTVGGSAEGKDTQGPPTFASSGFRWLDLDPDYPPETQRSILAEALNHCDNETVASYRGDQRYVPRLKPGAGITIEPGEVVALGLPGQGHVWIRPAAGDPFFSELSRQEKPPKTESPGLAGQTLLALPAADRSKALEKFLRSEFAEITGLELTDADLDKPLHSFGLDSLMAIQLRNRVEAELKISLSLVDFLKGLSLSQIVHNANQELAGPQTSEVSTPLAVPENSLGVLKAESVENLSEKDLDRFLQSLLEAERAPALPNSGAPHLTELP